MSSAYSRTGEIVGKVKKIHKSARTVEYHYKYNSFIFDAFRNSYQCTDLFLPRQNLNMNKLTENRSYAYPNTLLSEHL